MPDNNLPSTKKNFSLDWLVRGVLTRTGDVFDRITGRRWKPSSSLATSELIEKLKFLLDAEAVEDGKKIKYVPHNIKLKMQWDKFSTDAETALKKLEIELLTAAVDHINDRRYHTHAPLQLAIKPDYFTEGIKLSAGFDNFGDEGHEAAVNVTLPDLKNVVISPPPEIVAEPDTETYLAEFVVKGKSFEKRLEFAERQRLSVGRTRENDLWIDDTNVSKIHAALVLNSEKQLMVADTGSTNGTYINGERIAYGRAFVLKPADKLSFGTIAVAIRHIPKPVAESAPVENEKQNGIDGDVAPSETRSEKTISANEALPEKTISAAADVDISDDVTIEDKLSAAEIPHQTGQRIEYDFDGKK